MNFVDRIYYIEICEFSKHDNNRCIKNVEKFIDHPAPIGGFQYPLGNLPFFIEPMAVDFRPSAKKTYTMSSPGGALK